MNRRGLLSPLLALALVACPGGRDQGPAPAPSASVDLTRALAAPSASAGDLTREAAAPDAFGSAFSIMPIGPVVWSPDGQKLAVGSWLLSSDGKLLATLPGRPRGFSPDGRHAVFAGSEPAHTYRPALGPGDDTPKTTGLTVWSDGQSSAIERATVARWSADSGALLLRGVDDFQLWSAATRKVSKLPVPAREKREGVAFSRDGAALAVGAEGKTVLVDARNAIRRAEIDEPASPHTTLLTAGDRFLLLCSGDKPVRLVALADLKHRTLDISSEICSLDPGGKRLATVTRGDTVTLRVFDVDSGDEISRATPRDVPRALRWSHDGAYLAWFEPNKGTAVLDVQGRKVSHTRGNNPSFHPDRPLLAVNREDTTQLRDPGDLRLVASLPGLAPPWGDLGLWGAGAGVASTVRGDVWSLWGPDGAWQRDLPVLAAFDPRGSRGWGAPAITKNHASFAAWQQGGAGGKPSSVAVVARRGDGKRLYFRVIQGAEGEHMVVSDEAGHFFAEPGALGLFSVKTPAGELPAGQARGHLDPGLLASFFAGH